MALPEPSVTSAAITNLMAAFTDGSGGNGPLFQLLNTIAYVCGFYFIVRGLMMLKAFGQNVTMAAKPGEVAGPMVFIIVGIVFCYLPGVQDVSMETLFGSKEVASFTQANLSWAGANVTDEFKKLSEVVYWYLKFIGSVAFLRGWFILAKMGHPGAQPGSVGKGITHIVGGLLLMNIIDTAAILSRTFGFS